MKGNEWAAEESLKWLRGRGAEALDREIEKIKKEIAIRKRERNSITLLLSPQVRITDFFFCYLVFNRCIHGTNSDTW